MPEGDTLHRIAETLRRVLVGEELVRVRSALVAIDDAELAGRRVTAVEARGKNLLVTFDDGRTLHTHLRMLGRWLVYRRDDAPRVPADVRVALETATHLAMCVRAPVVRLLTPAQLRRDDRLRALGPDLLAPDFDASEALARLARLTDATLAEALLDQRAVAGIGNVYKSEVCFLRGLDPLAPVSAFTAEELRGALATARELLQHNVQQAPGTSRAPQFRVGRRATRSNPGARLWVYERAGEPCLRCRTAITLRRDTRDGRSTYLCTKCQPAR